VVALGRLSSLPPFLSPSADATSQEAWRCSLRSAALHRLSSLAATAGRVHPRNRRKQAAARCGRAPQSKRGYIGGDAACLRTRTCQTLAVPVGLILLRFAAITRLYRSPKSWPVLIRPVAILVTIFIEPMIAMLVKPSDAKRPHSTRQNAMMRALVLGAAALALSAGAASAQAVYPVYGYGPHGDGYTVTAPLYDYAGPASPAPVHTAPHGYGPLVYEAPCLPSAAGGARLLHSAVSRGFAAVI
jgi:hypothetical protein